MAEGAIPAAELRRLLEAAGYRGTERGPTWVGVRARDRRAVAVTTSAPSVPTLAAALPTDALYRTIYYPNDPGDAARDLGAERGIEILSPSTLGAALGELLLQPAAAGAPTDASAPLEPPAVAFPGGACSVRPRLDRAQAEALAGARGLRWSMKWVPCLVVAYRVRTPAAHGGRGPVRDRIVAVNLVARRAEIWEPSDRELTTDPPPLEDCLSAEVDEPLARGIACEAIRRHYAVRVEHTEQHGEALVIETRRVQPSLSDIFLGAPHTVYAPYWYAQGSGGRIVLDAVSGQRLGATADGS